MRTVATGAALLLAIVAPLHAHADTTKASCEVVQEGKEKKHATGPCTFSQRQGYVDIELSNGITHKFSPDDKPNHFHDAEGHAVVRTVKGNVQTYQLEGKRIIVTFDQ